MIYELPRYLYSGDQYLTIEIGDEMTLEANFKVIGLDLVIKEARIKGFIETFPGWRSLLLHYDQDERSRLGTETDRGADSRGKRGSLSPYRTSSQIWGKVGSRFGIHCQKQPYFS